jgi:hypothetical protein
MSRQIFYDGYKDPRVQHEPWCKSPHPNAIISCTCPASADLDYNKTLATMSVDQYGMLYKPAPMPIHKLKAIRHKRHVLRPDDPHYWPRDKNNRPYDPRRYGYPDNWLETPYGPASGNEEYVLFDHNGNPVESLPDLEQLPPEPPIVQYQAPRPRKKNYWEEDDAPTPAPPAPPAPVYPTNLPAEQREQYRQGPPMIPHTQQQCRAPLLMDVPGAPTGAPPLVLECEVEPNHPNQPHMTRVPGRRASQVIYVTWMDE